MSPRPKPAIDHDGNPDLMLEVTELAARPDLGALSPAGVEVGGHALRQLFPAISPADFVERHWTRAVYHEAGEPGRFHRLLPWAELNRILDGHRAWPLRMRVVKGNRPLAPSSYLEPIPGRGAGREPVLRVSSTKLHQRLRDGATLVFGSIDEAVPAIRELAQRLEYDLRAEVFVNLYLSSGGIGAFDPHWDDHDGIIVQVYGRKEWQLFGEGRRAPLPDDGAGANRCPPRPLEQLTLDEGGALYLPRGHWHAVRPVGEMTAHLTFGLRRPTVRDFLRWAVERQADNAEARFDLPLAGWTPDVAKWLTFLRGELDALLTAEGLRRYLVERDAVAAVRPRHGLPYAIRERTGELPAGAVVRLAAARPVPRLVDDTRCVVAAGGKRYEFAAACGPLVTRLLDGRAWPVAELCAAAARDGGPGEADCRRLLATLVEHGLLDLPAAGPAGTREHTRSGDPEEP